MLSKDTFITRFENGAHLLDCATGTYLTQCGTAPDYLAELKKYTS